MAQRKARKPPPEVPQDELPMTPMIDVIFQLVIFFMCSMHFKELQGKLQSYLPKDKGLNPTPVIEPELREVRVILRVNGPVVTASVEQKKIADFPAEPSKVVGSGISRQWDLLGQEKESLWKGSAATGKPIPVKIDASEKVPFQYVVSSLDACLRAGVKDIEFVGSGKVHENIGTNPKK